MAAGTRIRHGPYIRRQDCRFRVFFVAGQFGVFIPSRWRLVSFPNKVLVKKKNGALAAAAATDTATRAATVAAAFVATTAKPAAAIPTALAFSATATAALAAAALATTALAAAAATAPALTKLPAPPSYTLTVARAPGPGFCTRIKE